MENIESVGMTHIKRSNFVKFLNAQTKIRHISEYATGKRKTAGGYIWSYNSAIEEKE